MSEVVLERAEQSWEPGIADVAELKKAPLLTLISNADDTSPGEVAHRGTSQLAPVYAMPRSAPTAGQCTAAVRAYIEEMAAAGTYPGLNGYQRRARGGRWPGAKTVIARLGGWSQALVAGGFDAPRRPGAQFVSREDCVAAVAAYAADAAARGRHPGLVGYQRDARSRRWPSLTTVTARLGPWTAALAAAGVTPTDRKPTAQDCLLAVASYVAETTAGDLYPTLRGYRAMASRRGWPTTSIVIGHLGSWSKALGAAGFTRPRGPGRASVSRDDCISAIKAYIAEAGMAGRHPGVVGYDAVYQDRGWPQRQSSIIPRLGSWPGALAAAGYSGPIHERPHIVSHEECLVAVHAYCAEKTAAGQTPSLAGYGKLARIRGWPAVATVLARLGSWDQALRAAALHPRTPPPSSG